MRRRGRPHFTTRDIEQQLQQLVRCPVSHAPRCQLTQATASVVRTSSLLQYLLSSSVSTSSSDVEQLAPVIRNIAQSRQQDAYLKALKSFVAAKQAEIESVCARNYQVSHLPMRLPMRLPRDRRKTETMQLPPQDLIQYVSALLRVRQGTVSLKHRVIDLNEDLQKSGGGVVDKVRRHVATPPYRKLTSSLQRKELLDSRRVGQNIDEAIDTLQTCLGVLDVASQVQSLTNSAKYFSALRVGSTSCR